MARRLRSSKSTKDKCPNGLRAAWVVKVTEGLIAVTLMPLSAGRWPLDFGGYMEIPRAQM